MITTAIVVISVCATAILALFMIGKTISELSGRGIIGIAVVILIIVFAFIKFTTNIPL